jgi:capsular polysaccharide biosynthesis protein
MRHFRAGETIAHGVWISDDWSDSYFHWLADALPRLEAALPSLPNGFEIVVPARIAKPTYVLASLQLLQLRYRVMSDSRYHDLGDLTIPSHTAPTGNYRPPLMQTLRGRFRAAIGNPHTCIGLRVWITRRDAAKRTIANETELQSVLDAFGFTVVSLERLTFEEQVRLIGKAEAIAGLHGAGLTNMLFMRAGCKVVEIRRDGDAHNNCFFSLASSLDLPYFYSIARPLEPDLHKANCILNAASLRETLDCAFRTTA